ncbi:MAG: metallopeptidase TldD-related protein [bacterium]
MMDDRKIVRSVMDRLDKAGIDQFQVIFHRILKQEIYAEEDQIKGLKTNNEIKLELTGITNYSKGVLTVNNSDKESIDNAVEELLVIISSAKRDKANQISDIPANENFQSGPRKADLDLMYNRLKTLIQYVNETYPLIIQRLSRIEYIQDVAHYENSNGVQFQSKQGYYNFLNFFLSKKGKTSSSNNNSYFISRDLKGEIINYGLIDALLKQSSEQIFTKNIDEKFRGKVIITPQCLSRLINYFATFLTNVWIVPGMTYLKEKLNKKIASPMFTLHSRPTSNEMVKGHYFTHDGFKAGDCTLIERGVLKSFLLDLYGSLKTGLPRAVNDGGCYVVDPGQVNLSDIIKEIDRGILLGRISASYPSQNLDFNWVAKNSCYIENGKIQFPITETMISGNIIDLFKNIEAISREAVNFGDGIYPWILSDGVIISGK